MYKVHVPVGIGGGELEMMKMTGVSVRSGPRCGSHLHSGPSPLSAIDGDGSRRR